MNRNELTQKLNEMLVGKSAYNVYGLCNFIRDNLCKLDIDNTQGEYGVRLNAYTIAIIYKNYRLVEFDIKRKQDKTHYWVVKQVIVENSFVDYETSIKRIKANYEREITRFKEWHLFSNDLDTLKNALSFIREHTPRLTKGEQQKLLCDLTNDYWLVDEALESGGE